MLRLLGGRTCPRCGRTGNHVHHSNPPVLAPTPPAPPAPVLIPVPHRRSRRPGTGQLALWDKP